MIVNFARGRRYQRMCQWTFTFVENATVDGVGCMRNINVFLQEIGRAGRSSEGNQGLGMLFISEHKDDQRLGYWIKGCSTIDEQKVKDEYSSCWKWIYSIYSGDCLRKGIQEHYNDNTPSMIEPKDCCLCCESDVKKDFDIEFPLSLLLKGIKELEEAQKKGGGVSEKKLIAWLRGAKQDWLAEETIQQFIDVSETYNKGKEIDGLQWSVKCWENLIRQCVKLEYIDIDFKTFELKVAGNPIVRTYRAYKVSKKGDDFLSCPTSVKGLSPFACLLDKVTKKNEFTSRKRNSRNCHHLPKIKGLLANSQLWSPLERKDDYEFPGFSKVNALFFCDNFRSTSFAAKTREHYINDDNQLSKSSSQTQQHDVTVNGVKTKVYIKRSACEGVKVCSGCVDSTYTVSKRQRINRCPVHKKTVPLKETGQCPVQFIYVWPVVDDGRRWIGTINSHNHKKPAPHKISSQVQEDIQNTALNNLRCTAKDISKGLGMSYVPCERSIAASNIDRVRRERRLAVGSILTHGKGENNTNAMATITDFEKIRTKVENNQDEESSALSNEVNKLVGEYQMAGQKYIFTSTHQFAFFMAPFQQEQLAKAAYIFVDITYTGNEAFPYLLNVVSLNEQTLFYNAVGRVLCNKQDGEAYGIAFKELFKNVTNKFPNFKSGKNLEMILVDFDDAQAKGLKEAVGDDAAEKVLRGCQVHWMRSLQRVAKLVTRSKEEMDLFLFLGNQIPKTPEKEHVLKLFQILSGQKSILEVELLNDDMKTTAQHLNTQNWTRLKSWAEWWCRPNHLKMFTKAYTLMEQGDWQKAPATTNPVESINRQSIHAKGCALYALLENIMLEDRGHAAKIVATMNNVSLSYSGDEQSRRKKRGDTRKRKRSSLGDQIDDNAPPDKRRNIVNQHNKSKRKGRSMIGTGVSVEYQEMNGDKMENIGWFQGKIVAFNRRDGYFVEFEGKQAGQTTYKGWSEWIDDLDSPDVKIHQ